jgi:hypothetical protein
LGKKHCWFPSSTRDVYRFTLGCLEGMSGRAVQKCGDVNSLAKARISKNCKNAHLKSWESCKFQTGGGSQDSQSQMQDFQNISGIPTGFGNDDTDLRNSRTFRKNGMRNLCNVTFVIVDAFLTAVDA